MILDHVSPSQLDMWNRCPRQWQYRYVEGKKIPPSGALIEGRCYHKSVEVNFVQKIETGEDLPVDHCLDAFSTEWNLALSEGSEIDWQDIKPEDIKNEGHLLVKTYMTDQAPQVLPLEVETWRILEVAGVKFVTRIDLINHVGKVIDHKTSNRSYNQDDVDKDLQASSAAFALRRSIIFENHIAVKTAKPKIQVVKTIRTREDIEWWYDTAVCIVAQMKTGVAPPRPTGWWCSPKYCGFWELCRGGLIRGYWYL